MTPMAKWMLAASAFAVSVPAAAGNPLEFQVAADVHARVDAAGDGSFQVKLLPSGIVQQLQGASNEDGESSIDHADYNFDGYEDLVSSARMGQVNDVNIVYLFDPGSGRFTELKLPANAPKSCEGFWDLVPEPRTRQLFSSCRGGPMWYTDVYRYDVQGRLYVYRSERVVDPAVSAMLDLTPDDGAPVAVWSTYDPAGRVTERAVGLGLVTPPEGPLVPLQGVVSAERLPLHAKPIDGAAARYLVKRDRFEALDISEDGQWLKVRYRNPDKGAVVGWVHVPQDAL